MESDLVFARESANGHESIQELLDQVISGPDGLGCFRAVAGLVVETGAEHRSFVPGHVVVMA